MKNKVWTIIELIKWTTDFLQKHNIETPRLESEILLSHALNTNRLQLYLDFEKPIPSSELVNFKELIKRRAKHEPLAYIIGKREFWSLDFKVTRDVLIPRPDTELLVEIAIKTIEEEREKRNNHGWIPQIVDLGTGCGNIAISLAKELKDCQIYACDQSEKALKIAKENAVNHSTEDIISFFEGDLLEPLEQLKVDFIVSNPPYIQATDIPLLPIEVCNYEPHLSLNGGKDGLHYYRELFNKVPGYLTQEGYLIMEIGFGQKEAINDLLKNQLAFQKPHFIKDLAGIDRVVTAKFVGE